MEASRCRFLCACNFSSSYANISFSNCATVSCNSCKPHDSKSTNAHQSRRTRMVCEDITYVNSGLLSINGCLHSRLTRLKLQLQLRQCSFQTLQFRLVAARTNENVVTHIHSTQTFTHVFSCAACSSSNLERFSSARFSRLMASTSPSRQVSNWHRQQHGQ